MWSRGIERIHVDQFKISVTATGRFHGPSRPSALHAPRHLPVARLQPLPKMRSPRWHDERALQPARRREVGILEAAISNEFRVQPAISCMVDFFEEYAVQTVCNWRALLSHIHRNSRGL